MNNSYQYLGKELKLFETATNWKAYLRKEIKPYIRGKVLEVGAGTGATTKALNDGLNPSWTLLEPDINMVSNIRDNIAAFPLNTKVIHGTIENTKDKFDTIIYIDVLEHIENDIKELQIASSKLNKSGRLIILSPAYNLLFSPFDKAIGHYRRYSKKSLEIITPNGLRLLQFKYLDSLGWFASLANKMLLHQSLPSHNQISFWDKYLVAISIYSDRLIHYSFGKCILGIWEIVGENKYCKY